MSRFDTLRPAKTKAQAAREELAELIALTDEDWISTAPGLRAENFAGRIIFNMNRIDSDLADKLFDMSSVIYNDSERAMVEAGLSSQRRYTLQQREHALVCYQVARDYLTK